MKVNHEYCGLAGESRRLKGNTFGSCSDFHFGAKDQTRREEQSQEFGRSPGNSTCYSQVRDIDIFRSHTEYYSLWKTIIRGSVERNKMRATTDFLTQQCERLSGRNHKKKDFGKSWPAYEEFTLFCCQVPIPLWQKQKSTNWIVFASIYINIYYII